MPHRNERLSETLREELAELIGYEMSDPRVATVVVTEVLISPDKRHAQVRFGLSGGGDAVQAQKALEGAKSFLKRELSQRLDIFRMPDLHFEPDVSVTLGDRMAYLLKRVKKGRPRDILQSPGQVPEKKAVE
jgi:ribosome-binding factor A